MTAIIRIVIPCRDVVPVTYTTCDDKMNVFGPKLSVTTQALIISGFTFRVQKCKKTLLIVKFLLLLEDEASIYRYGN